MYGFFATNFFRALYAFLLLIPVLIVFVPAFGSGIDGVKWTIFFDASILPSLKSGFYAWYVATISTLYATLVGFAIYQCEKKRQKSLHGMASLLILPILLGNSSAAYLQKMILSNSFFSGFFEMTFTSGWLPMHLLGGVGAIWQYGSLGAYLCYLALTQLNLREKEYAGINQLPDRNFYFDFYIFRITSLSTILFLFFFLFSFYEYTKLYLLYKPSVVAGTELAAHSLARLYKTASIYDPSMANAQIWGSSLWLMLIVVISLLVSINLWIKLGRWGRTIIIVRLDNFFARRTIAKNWAYWIIGVAAILIALGPVAYGLIKFFAHLIGNMSVLFPLLNAIAPAISAAAVLSIFAAVCAVIARIYWPNYTSQVNQKFAMFVALSCIAITVPPITIAISWLYHIGPLLATGQNYEYIWGIAMLFAYLPLIVVFILASYLSIGKEEINYAKVHGLRLKNILADIFGRRFIAMYALIFLLSTSIILNDYTINNIFSDFVFSFSGVFDRSLIGRSENEALAASLLFLSVGIATLILFFWNVARRPVMGRMALAE